MDRCTAALIAVALSGSSIAVFLIAAFDWMSWACRLPNGITGHPLADGPLGCVDFWVQRYQSLLAAFGAATVAGVGITIAARQLATARNNYKGTYVANSFNQFEKAANRLIFIGKTERLYNGADTLAGHLPKIVSLLGNESIHHGVIDEKLKEIKRVAGKIVDEYKLVEHNDATEFRFRDVVGPVNDAAKQIEFISDMLEGQLGRVERPDQVRDAYRTMFERQFEQLVVAQEDFTIWRERELAGRRIAIEYWEQQYIKARDTLLPDFDR